MKLQSVTRFILQGKNIHAGIQKDAEGFRNSASNSFYQSSWKLQWSHRSISDYFSLQNDFYCYSETISTHLKSAPAEHNAAEPLNQPGNSSVKHNKLKWSVSSTLRTHQNWSLNSKESTDKLDPESVQNPRTTWWVQTVLNDNADFLRSNRLNLQWRFWPFQVKMSRNDFIPLDCFLWVQRRRKLGLKCQKQLFMNYWGKNLLKPSGFMLFSLFLKGSLKTVCVWWIIRWSEGHDVQTEDKLESWPGFCSPLICSEPRRHVRQTGAMWAAGGARLGPVWGLTDGFLLPPINAFRRRSKEFTQKLWPEVLGSRTHLIHPFLLPVKPQ